MTSHIRKREVPGGWRGVGAVNQWLISVIGHHGSPSQGWFSPAAFSTPAPGSGPRPPLDWEPSPGSDALSSPQDLKCSRRGAAMCPGSRGGPEPQTLGWGPDKPRLSTPGQAGLAQPLLQEGELTLAGDRSGNKISILRLQTQTDAQTEQARGCYEERGGEGGSEMGLAYANLHVQDGQVMRSYCRVQGTVFIISCDEPGWNSTQIMSTYIHRHVCVCESLCGTAEINTTLQTNYTSVKKSEVLRNDLD